MGKKKKLLLKRNVISIPLGIIVLLIVTTASSKAGPYLESGHGNTTNGVMRADMTAEGYNRGNCAHCHEQHSSVGGQEPAPVDGEASPFALFKENFDPTVTSYPYQEDDNICFSCHNDAGSIMQVTNKNYAETYGGYVYDVDSTSTIDSILDAFNPYTGVVTHSQHNLKDIYTYAEANFTFFTDSSNPCNACHNPHRAKRVNSDVTDLTLSAISRPTDHEALWGTQANETMKQAAGAHTYQPPYYWQSNTLHEPGGIANHDGSNTPDYNSFCLDCHQNQVPTTSTVSKNPNTPAGFLTAIDWSDTGDMHGGAERWGPAYPTTNNAVLLTPYNTDLASTTPNYVLSCLDCHTPHGTLLYDQSFLLRKMINGTRAGGNTQGPGHLLNKEWNWSQLTICQRCHDIHGHCLSNMSCFACHYHGSTVKSGCSAPGAHSKAF